ncbi:MAG: IS21-like element helper ATPase IstB [Pseudobdellovibrionaceae bacterium]
MTHEELSRNLRQLNLGAMASEYAAHAQAAEKTRLTYEQFLAGLVAAELAYKNDCRIKRLIRDAKLPFLRHLEKYDFSQRTGITDLEFKRLAKGDFVRETANVVLYGTFGLGKTHLAIALVLELVKSGIRCYFTSTHALIETLLEAKKTLTLAALFKRLDRFDVIVCDELGYIAQSQDGADLFFQLISQRSERKSLVITTNLTYSEWDKVFVNPLNTAAAIDRIIHRCETFNIQGPSWREEEAKKRAKLKRNLTAKHEIDTSSLPTGQF